MSKKAFVDPIWIKKLLPDGGLEDTLPIQIGKDKIRPIVMSGEYHHCTLCGQTIKLYPRSVNSAMVRQLIELFERGAIKSTHFQTRAGRGDVQMMAYWGLVAECTLNGDVCWEITPIGREWLRGQRTISRYAMVYNRQVYALSRETWSVSDAMGEDFDLDKIISPFLVNEAAE